VLIELARVVDFEQASRPASVLCGAFLMLPRNAWELGMIFGDTVWIKCFQTVDSKLTGVIDPFASVLGQVVQTPLRSFKACSPNFGNSNLSDVI
jgi:hypothetical protein